MSATYILTTPDAGLLSDWTRQLPVQPLAVARGDMLRRELQRAGARVWIKDVCDPESRLPAHPDTVIIVVGEPRSVPFEEARQAAENSYCLSYEESRVQLRRLSMLAGELARHRSVLSVVQARSRRKDPLQGEAPEPQRRYTEDLEFLAAAVDHLEDKARIFEEFRRGARSRIRTSRISVFLRDGKNFTADDGLASCPASHPLVQWVQEHEAIIDLGILETIEDLTIEAALRQKLGEWNCRLLVPLEANGVLDGWVVFGPRADGRPYSPADSDEALMLVRLLSRLLAQQRVVRWAVAARQETAAIQKNGPKFRVIPIAQKQDDTLPTEVREVLGYAFAHKTRVEREFGKLRVTAGPVAGAEACWVYWDEVESTEAERERRAEAERHRILHDLGIMISHELANAMFSVNTYFQYLTGDSAAEANNPLAERVKFDLDRMRSMPSLLSALFEMSKRPTAPVDMKAVLQTVSKEVGGTLHVPEAPLQIWGHEANLRDALIWLCKEIVETKERGEGSGRDVRFAITAQMRGQEPNALCLITIAYPGLRMEQLKASEPTSPEEYPTVPVYLAREIVRFHHGTVHVGQGIDGQELMISLKSRRVNALAELPREPRVGGSATPFATGTLQGPDAMPASA